MMIQRVQLFLSWFGLLVVCPPLISASCYTCGSKATVLSHWPNNFNAEFSIPITSKVSGGWKVALKFSKPVIDVKIWNADVDTENSKASLYILKNKHWNANLFPGFHLQMDFNAMFVEPMPEFTVRLIGQEDCGTCVGDSDKPDTATPAPDDATPAPDKATLAPPKTTSAPPDNSVTTEVPAPEVTVQPLGCKTCCSSTEILYEWPGGNFGGEFVVPIEKEVVGGWVLEIVFSEPVIELQVYDTLITGSMNGDTIYRLKSKPYMDDLAAGTYLRQSFLAMTSAESAPSFTVHMGGQSECCEPEEPGSCVTPTTAAPPFFDCPATEVKYVWQGGFRGKFWIPIRNEVVGGWTIRLDFSEEILYLETFRANIDSVSNNNRTFFVTNKDYNADQTAGTMMIEQFRASVETTPTFTAVMIGQPSCAPSTTPSDDSDDLPREGKKRRPTFFNASKRSKRPLFRGR